MNQNKTIHSFFLTSGSNGSCRTMPLVRLFDSDFSPGVHSQLKWPGNVA